MTPLIQYIKKPTLKERILSYFKALYYIRYIIGFCTLCLLGFWKIIDILIWLAKHIKIVL